LWVNSFDDYVDDFVYFVTMVGKESPNHPIFLLAHSMGGLIGSMAMARCVFALLLLLIDQRSMFWLCLLVIYIAVMSWLRNEV
jgi:alpha-beta hydrolase superfamily lysophospholipase